MMHGEAVADRTPWAMFPPNLRPAGWNKGSGRIRHNSRSCDGYPRKLGSALPSTRRAWEFRKTCPGLLDVNDFVPSQNLFFLTTKLVPFILIHLKKLSTVEKVNHSFLKCMGRVAEQASELTELGS